MEWTNMECTMKRRRWELPLFQNDSCWEVRLQVRSLEHVNKKLLLHTSSTSFDTTIICFECKEGGCKHITRIFFSYGKYINNDTSLRKTGVILVPNFIGSKAQQSQKSHQPIWTNMRTVKLEAWNPDPDRDENSIQIFEKRHHLRSFSNRASDILEANDLATW